MSTSSNKALWLFGFLLLMLEIAYVILANSFLRSNKLEEILNGKPEKLLVTFEEPVSYFPGFLVSKRLRIAGHDGSVKWKVDARHVRAWISLSQLMSRTLLVNSISVDEAQVSVLTRQERMAPLPKKKRAPFRLKFRNLDIANLSHFRVHDYLYTGDARVSGDFDLWPGRRLDVWRSRIVPLGGPVAALDTQVLSGVEGEISVKLLNFLPKQHKKLEILDLVKKATIELRGDLSNPRFLNLYLQGVPWLEVTKLKGAMSARLTVRDGKIADESRGAIKAERIDLRMGPYTSQGWGRVSWELHNQKLFRLGLSLDDYSFHSAASKKPFMTGHKLRMRADTKALSLQQMFTQVKDLGIEVLVERAKVTKLSTLNDFVPVTDKFRVDRGEAELNAHVLLSTRDKGKKGYLVLKTQNAHSRFRDLDFRGDAEFNCEVQDTEEGIEVFKVTNAKLRLNGVSIIKPKTSAQKKVLNWHGDFNIPDSTLRPYHNIIVDGAFNFTMSDAEPLLLAMRSEFRLARLVQTFTAARDLRGQGAFKIGPKLLDISNLKITSSDVDILGRYRFFGSSHKLLVWFKFDTFKAAISYGGKNTDFALNNALRWYEMKPAWPPLELKRVQ